MGTLYSPSRTAIGHPDLGNCEAVRASGAFKIKNGLMEEIDNGSGHYLPCGESAAIAAQNAFQAIGIDIEGKYIELFHLKIPLPFNFSEGSWCGATKEIEAKLLGMLFENLYPEFPLKPYLPQDPEQIRSTKFSGHLLYVVTQEGDSGRLILSKATTFQSAHPHRFLGGCAPQNRHLDLANGEPVRAAGWAYFKSGKLVSMNNAATDYKPSGKRPEFAALKAFSTQGFQVDGKYIENHHGNTDHKNTGSPSSRPLSR